MTTRWFGAPVQRVEDDRLLRGRGRFTDDIDEGALECCFVRSPHAHARITSIDVNEARAMPGVAAVYTAADLPFGGLDLPLLIPHPNLTTAVRSGAWLQRSCDTRARRCAFSFGEEETSAA